MASRSFIRSVVTIEILLKLPVKSLCRFRCVSKSFRNLLTDPHFVKMHLMQLQRRRLILSSDSTLYSIDPEILYDDNKTAAVKLECAPVENPFILKDSCNGLLLFQIEGCEETKFLVHNPSTKESRKIESTKMQDVGRTLSIYHRGFGYAKCSDDYKFVEVLFSPTSEAGVFSSEVGVFSLRTNLWRSAQNDFFPIDVKHHPYWGVFLNGAIHWPFRQGIGAFDLDEEKWKMMPYPVALENSYSFFNTLGVAGNCLCVLCCTKVHEGKFDFFIMKEYGVKQSWYRIYIDLAEPYILLRPLSFWKNDRGIIFFGANPGFFNFSESYFSLVGYQEDGRVFKEIKIVDDIKVDDITNIVVYVESMVSPIYKNH